MLIPVLLFIVGLVLLVKGGDWFVDGATGIAQSFHVPELLIGATIVSIGTTLPEVMVSANSALAGHGEIAYGNAIGSIICNTALVCAITVAIRPAAVDRKPLRVPVIFFFIAAVFYAVIAFTGAKFSRWTGIVLLVMFGVYAFLTIRQAMQQYEQGLAPVSSDDSIEEETTAADSDSSSTPIWKHILLLAVGAVMIAYGADLLVDNGTLIAEGLGVPEAVIALTFVALGTSLPELVTAITSLIKGHSSLSLGNIIGANLFNLVLVSGLSITLSPFSLPAGRLIAGINTSIVVDIPLVFITMLTLTLPALIRQKLSRVQGIVLLAIYAGFVAFQFLY